MLGLTLVLAPHLARSYHHLFPLPMFNEIILEEERFTLLLSYFMSVCYLAADGAQVVLSALLERLVDASHM